MLKRLWNALPDRVRATIMRFVKVAVAAAATALITYAAQHVGDVTLPPAAQAVLIAVLTAAEKALRWTP